MNGKNHREKTYQEIKNITHIEFYAVTFTQKRSVGTVGTYKKLNAK